MKRICLILPLVFLLASCTEVYRYTREEFYSMTTVVTVISDADTDFAETRQFASDFENRVSRTKTDSERKGGTITIWVVLKGLSAEATFEVRWEKRKG